MGVGPCLRFHVLFPRQPATFQLVQQGDLQGHASTIVDASSTEHLNLHDLRWL